MGNNVLKPADPVRSQYTIEPGLLGTRGANLPEMTSISMRDLIPSIPDCLYPGPEGIEAVKKATRRSLSRVDLGKIKKGDSVNILASHHGFTLLGGPLMRRCSRQQGISSRREPERTTSVCRAGVGLRFKETEEYIKRFGLDKYLQRKGEGHGPRWMRAFPLRPNSGPFTD